MRVEFAEHAANSAFKQLTVVDYIYVFSTYPLEDFYQDFRVLETHGTRRSSLQRLPLSQQVGAECNAEPKDDTHQQDWKTSYFQRHAVVTPMVLFEHLSIGQGNGKSAD